jgi:hypothetical protein
MREEALRYSRHQNRTVPRQPRLALPESLRELQAGKVGLTQRADRSLGIIASRGLKLFRSPSLFVFHEVLNNSFGTALESLLGRGVREEVYRILEKQGIRKEDLPSKFDKVIEALRQVFGECSRVIIHRVLRVLYEQYSLPVDFSYQETLLDRLTFLRDKIVIDNLRPRGLTDRNFA